MFRCNECRKAFYHPHSKSEYVGEWFGFPAYEDFCYCPHCNSDEFDSVDDTEITEDDIECAKYIEQRIQDEDEYLMRLLNEG